MNNETPMAQGPVDVNVRGAWVVHSLHAVLLASSVFGAMVAWGWGGPFAGTIWSGVCFTFGVMFGLRLQRQAHNAK
jgi:hypothetical protein